MGETREGLSFLRSRELSVGEHTCSAVGNYTSPSPLQGKVENVKVGPQASCIRCQRFEKRGLRLRLHFLN